ncbi:DUF1223 domain-containing protein [Pontixanthobacter aestiaquae]|uniref:DUF1223 domain-containing protein n=1 Tax=Pontixanthobacter aestiaquae TaxID=1509367 RepID=A0A844Z425_9SPHN|nr:DUF1223 domain-containing protein [Pontixanthobacter aestiaquae]MDN3646764.1 DUF1223 domain-containing protein [Pontixanthobacter aestiaquae]MXO82254.1 DUF1223 domain-containing protein [Pontixanthobacter aestiaquae]
MQKSGLIVASGITALVAIGAATLSSGQVDARQGAKSSGPIASTGAPVVLELFTSQGCSSCPPADKLATRLAKDPSLLVISRPVTYWDPLGWKDTLGKQVNTDLQRAYARKGNEGAGVYTPQIVVDGRHGAVGSNERNVTALARDAAMKPKPTLIAKKGSDGSVRVSIVGKYPANSQLSLVALSSHETVKIGRGENGGRTISYTNVLIDETRLGADKRAIIIAPGQMQNREADRYAIILRQTSAGPILAGRML